MSYIILYVCVCMVQHSHGVVSSCGEAWTVGAITWYVVFKAAMREVKVTAENCRYNGIEYHLAVWVPIHTLCLCVGQLN